MATTVSYEWCKESLDEYGDIIDLFYADKIEELYSDDDMQRICLVRFEGETKTETLEDRHYAYIQNGKLPEYFEESYISVPKKYHNELQKHTNK